MVLTFTQTCFELFSICVQFKLIDVTWKPFEVQVRWRESQHPILKQTPVRRIQLHCKLHTNYSERRKKTRLWYSRSAWGILCPVALFLFLRIISVPRKISCSVFHNRFETRDDFLWWNHSAHCQNINDVSEMLHFTTQKEELLLIFKNVSIVSKLNIVQLRKYWKLWALLALLTFRK